MHATETLSPDQAAALFDLPRPASECRIVVAMSGGVDSSVVAALAARTGAEVLPRERGRGVRARFNEAPLAGRARHHGGVLPRGRRGRGAGA